MNQQEFAGKVVIVTGATSGIGKATALAFGREGASVVLADWKSEGSAEIIKKIEAMDRAAIFVKTDVSNEAEVKNLMNRSLEAFGGVDCAFNNAGIEGLSAFTHECSTENWDQVININLKGVWLCMKYQLQIMLKNGGGSIVNCSSIAGLVGFQGIPAYVASKHGVVGLTKTAALEYAKKKIRVNAICPGVIQTPMIDRFTHGEASLQKVLIEGEPLGRVGQPEEIADAALWLCSSSSSFVTGQAIAVDGGWVAQ